MYDWWRSILYITARILLLLFLYYIINNWWWVILFLVGLMRLFFIWEIKIFIVLINIVIVLFLLWIMIIYLIIINLSILLIILIILLMIWIKLLIIIKIWINIILIINRVIIHFNSYQKNYFYFYIINVIYFILNKNIKNSHIFK